MKSILSARGWQEHNYLQSPTNTPPALVILRDPVERWVSGMSEYFARNHPQLHTDQFHEGFMDRLLERMTLDDHTRPQTQFMSGLDRARCHFLLCDHDFSANFCHWLKAQGLWTGHNYTKYPRLNATHPRMGNRPPAETVRSRFHGVISPWLQQPHVLARIKQYYQEDYDLLEHAASFFTKG
jgi:hypothetical protein